MIRWIRDRLPRRKTDEEVLAELESTLVELKQKCDERLQSRNRPDRERVAVNSLYNVIGECQELRAQVDCMRADRARSEEELRTGKIGDVPNGHVR